jgi:uncharacterized membrane protein
MESAMSFIGRKTQRWAGAGLISEEQARGIVRFEKDRGAGRLLKGMYGLGAFSVLIGVLAIVAANWQAIPPDAKLIAHIMLNIGPAAAVYVLDRRGAGLAREISLFALSGLTLTLIALTGQVFHLNGSIGGAFILWALLCTPFMLIYGRTWVSLLPWLGGFLTAIFAGVDEYLMPLLSDTQETLAVIGLAMGLPVAFMYGAGIAGLLNRPALRDLLFKAAAIGTVLLTSAACLLWYDGRDDFIKTPALMVQVLGFFAFAGLGMALTKYLFTRPQTCISDETRLFMFGSLGVGVLPFILLEPESSFLGALSFIAYWLFLGLIGQRTGRQGLVSLAITVVALRIYFIYLELFGSLLMTGFGLISSGLILIGMVWGIRKLSRAVGKINLEGDGYE